MVRGKSSTYDADIVPLVSVNCYQNAPWQREPDGDKPVFFNRVEGVTYRQRQLDAKDCSRFLERHIVLLDIPFGFLFIPLESSPIRSPPDDFDVLLSKYGQMLRTSLSILSQSVGYWHNH